MGVLETLRAAPVLLVGLLAGVWIDRMREPMKLYPSRAGMATIRPATVETRASEMPGPKAVMPVEACLPIS